MRSGHVLSALFCIAVSAPLTAHAASPQPSKGFYNTVPFITAAKPAATPNALRRQIP